MKVGDKVLIKKTGFEDKVIEIYDDEGMIKLKEYGWFHSTDIESRFP